MVVCMYVCTVHIRTFVCAYVQCIYVRMCVCTVHIRSYVRMYSAYTFVCTYVQCIYVRMCVCMHICQNSQVHERGEHKKVPKENENSS